MCKEQIVEDYDVDVRNVDKGVVDIRNNVVDKCCKQSKTCDKVCLTMLEIVTNSSFVEDCDVDET